MIHELADVKSSKIGKGTNIWQFCVVLEDAVIGSNCNICSQCFIENDVTIGDNVTIKSGTQIWDGMIVGDNVFIGANVSFINDKYPKSRNKDWNLESVIIENDVSIGSGATIMAGVRLGKGATIGAGSVVIKDVGKNDVVVGNPARKVK